MAYVVKIQQYNIITIRLSLVIDLTKKNDTVERCMLRTVDISDDVHILITEKQIERF